MLFNSFQFLVFFPVVTLLYFLCPYRWRWLHLLISSCIFYAAFIPIYLLILVFTIVVDYIAGILIERAVPEKKKRLLILSIAANVGVLAVFKYYNFFIENINAALHALGVTVHTLPGLFLILPIGLSFHTFQAMSYTIEVYRGKQAAEKHFGIYALYVMFYPQLVAGPIERPQNLLHQFHERKSINLIAITEGLQLMLWGFFKKIVIADRLGLLVNEVYGSPHEYKGLTFLMATVFFAFQIYCDFSGYSSIAVGCARVMGFDLMNNFDRPYLARSIREFWQRWHISLSTWFRDYVYIPLGGNKASRFGWYKNIFLTFLISGIWHGASWTFVVWGALHGAYFIAGAAIQVPIWTRLLKNVPQWMEIAVERTLVFALVGFAWIFFRADSITDATWIVQNITDVRHFALNQLSPMVVLESKHTVYTIDILLGWMWILTMIISEGLISEQSFNALSRSFRWPVYIGAIIIILVLGVYNNNEFVYFQF